MTPTRDQLVQKIAAARDLPPGQVRRDREAELERALPGSDVVNLLKSDLPSGTIADLCSGPLASKWAHRKLSRDELLGLVRAIMAGPATSEAESILMVELFAFNCHHPAGTDLIFYPDEAFGSVEEITPEMVIDKALEAP